MSHFVLIHGAWHGGWCWNKVIPFLEERGHTVAAPDLPLEQPFEAYVDTALAAIDEASGPVILVGHSLGGVVITQVAERVPQKIERLVYVTAFAFNPDGSDTFPALAGANVASALRGNMDFIDGGKLAVMKPDVIPG
ncbi:MAG TPA: alpha/beta fold hydrolase, partial [Pseudomonadales bacterium]|nr:alpha/beta fold hydrolase [Pseudomonadales bacterium]